MSSDQAHTEDDEEEVVAQARQLLNQRIRVRIDPPLQSRVLQTFAEKPRVLQLDLKPRPGCTDRQVFWGRCVP